MQCEDGVNVVVWWHLQNVVLCSSQGADSVLAVWCTASDDWLCHHASGLLLRCSTSPPTSFTFSLC